MKAKQINCDLNAKQLFDLGEPVTYFTAEFPKEIKNLGKYTDGSFFYDVVYLEPSSNKLVATTGQILGVVNVKCSGVWEDDSIQEDCLPFQCHLDPKAIKEFAGKKVDFAVWKDNDHIITACETDGVTAQCYVSWNKKLKWRKVVPNQELADATLSISQDKITDLRKFLKEHQGTTRNDRDIRQIEFSVDAQTNRLFLKVYDDIITHDAIAVTSIDLTEPFPSGIIYDIFPMHVQLKLVNLATTEDFTGDISLHATERKITFKGDHRTSIMIYLRDDE